MPRSNRPYRFLVHLFFPPEVRSDFGPEMEDLFLEHRRRARGFAVVKLWWAAVVDAFEYGLLQRYEELKRPGGEWDPPAPSRWWMDTIRHDLRFALRMLLRHPAASAMMLLTLALGIGANTAVFSVVNTVLLRPLPYPEPDQIVMVYEKRPAEGVMTNVVSPADYLDWARLNQSFSRMAAFSDGSADLTGVGDPVNVPISFVTAGFFDLFGGRALHGRLFAPDEDVLGKHRVAVLGHALWLQRFGGDASVVGRSIVLNGVPQQVIGVLGPAFESPRGTPDIWLPLVLQGGAQPPSRNLHSYFVYGRMKPGVALEAARSEMDAIGRQLEEQYPNDSRGHGAHVVSLRDQIVEPVRNGLIVLAMAVAFVLLIACTNVANLLLASAASRRRELAIRAAVGAGRMRLVRQALTESVVLATLSGVLGLGVAVAGLRVLVAQTPPILRGVGLDRAGLDPAVLGFTLGLCVLTGVLAGLLPAWLMSRDDPGEPLREGGRAPSGLRKSVRFTLIAVEVSLTSLLLIGAGLMLRSFERVLSQPAGIETADRLVLGVTMPRSRYADPDAVRRGRHEIDARLRSIAGVQAVGATAFLPLAGADGRRGIVVEGLERREGDAPVRAHPRVVTPGYFRAIGIHLKSGRGFTEDDNATAPLVTVINDTMARRYWPNASPIGRRVQYTGDQWREVIGVIDDVRHWGLDREVNPEMYVPHEQQPLSNLAFVLHTTSPQSIAVPEIKRLIQEFDPSMPLGTIRTLEEVASRSVAARRWSAVLLGTFAILAVVLAGIGIYGVMAQLVSTRTSEIGIRLTLGARPVRVLRQVLGEGVLHAALGLTLGLALSLLLMGGLRTMLYGIEPSDPLTLAITAGSLLLVAAGACLVPALRAMRIDPVQALRTE